MPTFSFGLSGYPNDREKLGLLTNAPIYLWDFGSKDDRYIIRNSAIYKDDKWQTKTNLHGYSTIADFAAAHPGGYYYSINEPNYTPHTPTAKQLMEVQRDLTAQVASNGIVLSPAFSQPEIGNCWWEENFTGQGPDGKLYSYAESYLQWMQAAGISTDILQFHFYPNTGINTNGQIQQLHAVVTTMRALQERYCSKAQLWLTEVGYITESCAGKYGSYGWLPGIRFMRALVEDMRNGLVDTACWFLPRSEGCLDPVKQTGGWPGYLVYSDRDPNGSTGGSFLCDPWYFTVHCRLDFNIGKKDTLTPLGDVWNLGSKKSRQFKIHFPFVQGVYR